MFGSSGDRPSWTIGAGDPMTLAGWQDLHGEIAENLIDVRMRCMGHVDTC